MPRSARFVRIASMMENNDKPEVEVKLAEDEMTDSIVVTFPFKNLAFADEVCRVPINKMPLIAKALEF